MSRIHPVTATPAPQW